MLQEADMRWSVKRLEAVAWCVVVLLAVASAGCGEDITKALSQFQDAGVDGASGVTDTGGVAAPDVRVDVGQPDTKVPVVDVDDGVKGPLAIITVKPANGPTKGGIAVAIQGQGMRNGVEVLFGEVPATNVAVQEGILLTCVLPPGDIGIVDVTLKNPDGESATLPEGFEYIGELAVTEVIPTSGPVEGGTPAVIKGAGFIAGAKVLFGDTEAADAAVEGSGLITCTVPAGAEGSVAVTVRNPDGESYTLEDAFSYVDETPLDVVQVVPSSGPEGGGGLAVIKGQGFKTGATVWFGEELAAEVTVQSSVLLTCVVPAGAPGTIDVTVRNPDQVEATLTGGYEYIAESVLTVQGVTPVSGPAQGGTVAIVKGQGFAAGASVKFGGNPATGISVHSDGLISVTVPAGFPGPVDVIVENPDGKKATAGGAYEYLAATALGIDQVQPSSGPVDGGGVTVIKGLGFAPGATVAFGANPATGVTVESSSLITCVAPAGAAGFVDVVVQNKSGDKATLVAGYKYVKDEKLSVSEVQPSSGPASGGGLALIKGQGFKAGAKVSFGSTPAVAPVVETDTLITCTVPAGQPGAVPVTVENLDGAKAALADGYTYKVDAPLAITEVSPASGAVTGGGFVLVKGQSFVTGTTVSFGGALATGVTVESGTIISAVVPKGAPGKVDVVVKTPAGKQATLVGGYEYVLEAKLAIAQVTPTSGPASGGGLVVIKGQGFAPSAQVTIGGTPATAITVETSSLITCVAPAGAPGPADVAVKNPDGATATLADAYQYVAASVLSVGQIVPGAGPTAGGVLVVIKGTGFEPGATVRFGAVSATGVSVESASLLTAVTPPGSAGAVDVTVTNPGGAKATLEGGYTYVSDTPLVVTQIVPASGPLEGGTLALVKGQGIEAGAAVWFGGVPVANATVESSGTISVLVPAGAVAGKVDVKVRNPSGAESTAIAAYEYTTKKAVAVTQVVPASGPASGGGVAVVKGAGFEAGAVVSFGGVKAPTATVESGTVITATVPAHGPGAVDVKVQNLDGQSATLVGGYEYVADVALAVTEVLPSAGPAAGGNLAVIKGQGFEGGATVTFGAGAATGVTVQSSTLITATVPPGVAGKVDVTVSLPGGDSSTLKGAYTYEVDVVLTVASVEPATGPAAGGNLVVVKGQGFAADATVRFGAKKALDVTVESSTLLTCTAPAGAAGVVDVQVQNLDGVSSTLDAAYTYTTTEVLSVSSIFPASGSELGGYLIMVTGTGFGDGTAAWLGDELGLGVGTPSSNLLLFLAPAHAPGAVDLRITGPTGSEVVVPGAFEYLAEGDVTAQPPAIGALAPATGPVSGGTPVQVLGAGFVDGATVSFGAKAAAEVVWLGPATLLATTPAATAGAVDVKVTNPDGTSTTLTKGFKYVAVTSEPPTITQVTPGSGPTTGGTVAGIEGTGFQPGALVWFGTKPAAQAVVAGAELIVVTTPSGEVGSTDVTVVNPDGSTAILPNGFSYWLPGTVPAQPPLVGAVFPSSGWTDGGEEVLISGAGFTAGSSVWIGGLPSTIVKLQGTSLIRVMTPAHAAGTVDVTVTSPQGLSSTLKSGFVYFDFPPFVGVIDPSSGPTAGGTQVSIHGKHFDVGAQVQLGGSTLSGVTWVSSERLDVVLPAHAAGAVDVTVTNPSGLKDTLVGGYTYTLPEPPVPPTVTGVSPADGPAAGGTLVVVSGDGFATGATVKFGNTLATAVNVAAPTVLTAVSPAGAPGTVTGVTVTNPSGLSATLPDAFTWQTEGGGQPLSVTSVVPPQAPASGGYVVTVAGTGFLPGTTVHFGTYESQTVTFVSSTVLTVVTPAAPAGLTDVVVERPDKQKVIAWNAFLFTSAAPGVSTPAITSVSPGVGPTSGDTPVEVHGTGFQDGAVVYFGAKVSTDVTFVSSSLVVARSPASAVGTASITLTNPDGGSAVLAGAFTWYEPVNPKPPLVLAADPYQGSALGGTEVTLFGKDFQPGVSVLICGSKAVVDSVTGANVVLHTPAGPLGPCDIEAVNPDGLSSTLDGGFKYVPAQPAVTDIIPKTGPEAGGTSVVLHGSSFMDGAEVWFGPNKATDVAVWSVSSVKAVTPLGVAGAVDVKVINPGGAQTVVTGGFTYQAGGGNVDPPTVTALFPAQGPTAGGTPVEIQGTGFQQGLTVLLAGKVVGQVAVVDATKINIITPSAAPGKVALTILNPDGLGVTQTDAFEYKTQVADPPVLVGISPAAGPAAGGTPVTITGQNFGAGGQLYLGGKGILNQAFINTQVLTGIVPKADKAGKVDLLYVGPDGQFTKLVGAWDYIPGPTVDGVEPVLGPQSGGTQVTAVGSNMQPGVKIYIGGKQAQLLNLASALLAVVVAPAADAPGAADVTAVNPDGQVGTLKGGFLYLAPPSITALKPTEGPETGGTPVTVYGTAFYQGVKVLFDGQASPQVTMASSAQLVALAPAHAPGPVDVVVENVDGQKGTAVGAFTFKGVANLDPPPTITSYSPMSGPTTGGITLTIQGSDFQIGALVRLGVYDCTNVVRLDASTLLAVTPATVAGSYALSVINPDGQAAIAGDLYEAIAQPNLPPAPKITSIIPPSGPTAGGSVVELVGSGFADGMAVLFDLGTSSNVTVVSATSAMVVVPAHAPAKVDVTVVSVEGQVAVAKGAFTYIPPPKMTGITPSAAPSTGGTALTIKGQDFSSGAGGGTKAAVIFCEDAAAASGCVTADPATVVVSLGGTQINLPAPPHAPATVDVTVINEDGQKHTLVQAFIYNPLPSLLGVAPAQGSSVGGTLASITGTDFQQGAVVKVGGTACASLVFQSASKLACTTPPGAVGPADISIVNPDGGSAVLAGAFTYVPPPTIGKITPNIGDEAGGTTVTIEGSNFVVGPPGSEVRFGLILVPPEDTSVLDSKVIVVKTPPGQGSVKVSVTNPDGQKAEISGGFVYVPPTPAPLINYVVPAKGSILGGYVVQVVGSQFMDGAQVLFGTTGDWSEATDIQVKNAGTLITMIAPAHAAGIVDVRVVNTDGQVATKAGGFEFKAPSSSQPLAFSSISPSRGIVGGGTVATVSGQGFAAGVQVYFGNDPDWTKATLTERLGPTLLRVVTPPSPTGLAQKFDVKVANPPTANGQESVIKADAFEYTNGALFIEPLTTRLPPEQHSDVNAEIGDLNGDGYNDVYVARNGWDRLMLNVPQTDGTSGFFQTSWPISSPSNYMAYSKGDIALGDIDEDGDIDVLIVIANAGNRVYRCYNNGTDSFSCGEIIGSNGCGTQRIYLTDVSCDGHLDLLVANYSTSTSCPNWIYKGNGSGGFSSVGVLPPHYENTRAMAFADVDLDGDVDLLLANDDAMQNRLYLNNCNNTPLPPACNFDIPGHKMLTYNNHRYAFVASSVSWASAKSTCEYYGFELASINDDAERDFIKANATTSYSWVGMSDLVQEGSWVWEDGTSSYGPWCGGEPNGGTPENCARYYNSSNCMHDVGCGNGYHYVCEAETDTCPSAWGFTDTLYGAGKNFPISGGNTRQVSLVDIDGNGFPDAIIGNYGQQTEVYMNDGGTFDLDDGFRWPQNEEDPYIVQLFPVDVDLDNDVDFLVRGTSGALRLYMNDLQQGGAGLLKDQTIGHLPTDPWRGDAVTMAVGDLNSDLLPDIYLVNSFYQDRILINGGYKEGKAWTVDNMEPPGVFVNNLMEAMPDQHYLSRASVMGDIDGDGDEDLVKCGSNAPIKILVNVDGRFVDESEDRVDQAPVSCSTKGITLDDLDNDGSLDIVVTNNKVYQYFNDGTGHFDTQLNGTDWVGAGQCVKTADIDMDGDKDVFMCNYSAYYYNQTSAMLVQVGLNNGQAYFVNQLSTWFPWANVGGSYAWGSGPLNQLRNAYFVDMDGIPPLDMYLVRDGQNVLALNNGGAGFTSVTTSYLPSVSDNTYDVALVDFDLDGDLDIYSANWGNDRYYSREGAAGYADITTSSLPGVSAVQRQSITIAADDLDDDALPDVIISNYEQGNTMLGNLGEGVFTDLSANIPEDWDRSYGVHLSDVDGDGDLDIIFVNEGQDRVYLNTWIP